MFKFVHNIFLKKRVRLICSVFVKARLSSTLKCILSKLKLLKKIIFLGQSTPLAQLSLAQLMPDTRGYLTYGGSMTEPGDKLQ